jgi:uncharacterized protein (TIGR02145 family)
MAENNRENASLIQRDTSALNRIGNSIEITNRIIKEREERIAVENFRSVKIGKQEWIIKNLDVTCYNNGDSIPQVADNEKWKELSIGAWCYSEDIVSNDKCEKLYNYYALNDKRGLIPKGFRLPTQSDFEILGDFLENDFDRKVASGKKEYFFNDFFQKFKIGTRLWNGEYRKGGSHFWADAINYVESEGKPGFWTSLDESNSFFCTYFLEGFAENNGFSIWLLKDN